MANFKINFAYPWLLLLLILAALLTFIPYFRLNKRYRCTRNRIVSMALHIIIMCIAIPLLAGMTIEYDLPNDKNEVIVLVDSSFSGQENEQDKNEFVQAVIDNNQGFRLGVVTFGYDQVYASELTYDMTNVYTDYLQAPLPDISATDVEAALNYAATLFEYPDSARIVLISDAVETDGEALKTIKSIAAQGIEVDVVHFPDAEASNEVQIIAMERPAAKIEVGKAFELSVTLQSSYEGTASIIPYDNGVAGAAIPVELIEGTQSVAIPFEFAIPGIHKMSFELSSPGDTLEQNNVFHSFMYLEIFDKVLVIESNTDESKTLCAMLNEELNVTVMNITDPNLPSTVNELRAFDEIILCNIANSDMPEGFDKILQSYVYDIGGGLFTVCGNEYDSNPYDESWTANAYTREDMYDSIYQEMLPVEVINYTPPTAVMVIIDRSGSMSTYPDGKPLPDSENKLIFAKKAAVECVELLSERDFVGVMSFADDHTVHIGVTARTQRDKILASIEHMSTAGLGGTNFSVALERAHRELNSVSGVENKHIIIITDGEPSATDADRYKYWLQENAKAGITTSVVGVNCTSSAKKNMELILTEFAGVSASNFHDVNDLNSASSTIKKDFEVTKIQDVNYTTFKPTLGKLSSAITAGITEDMLPELNGFYGVKIKEGAEIVLMGPYTPIYAQWAYGKGTVGTFACDLNGVWSKDFVESDVGTTIVNNIVLSVFPRESIRPAEIELEVEGNNYTTKLNVFTELIEGESIRVTVTSPAVGGEAPETQVLVAGFEDAYTRFTFAVKTPGIHEILTQKIGADGAVLAESVTYKALSYSLEYNAFTDADAALANAEGIAAGGRGYMLEDPWQVYEHMEKYRHVVIDPRIPLAITLIVLFLLDIAVRKFKWKWPHEIIRDRRIKKEMKSGKGGR